MPIVFLLIYGKEVCSIHKQVTSTARLYIRMRLYEEKKKKKTGEEKIIKKRFLSTYCGHNVTEISIKFLKFLV